MSFWLLLKDLFQGFLKWLGYEKKQEKGYNPKPTQPSYQPIGQTLSEQSIGDNSFGNNYML
jgi:hypothetical protein